MTGFFDRRKLDLLLAVFARLQYGRLAVTLPDGSRHEFVGDNRGPQAEMRIASMGAVSRMIGDGKMGFCEAVMVRTGSASMSISAVPCRRQSNARSGSDCSL